MKRSQNGRTAAQTVKFKARPAAEIAKELRQEAMRLSALADLLEGKNGDPPADIGAGVPSAEGDVWAVIETTAADLRKERHGTTV